MKPAGAVLCVVGLLAAFYFMFGFDTSVPTETGRRINNIGLIADRQNGLMFSLGLAVIGAILLVGGIVREPERSPEEARRSRNRVVLAVLGTLVLIVALGGLSRWAGQRRVEELNTPDPRVIVTMRLKPSAIEITNDTDEALDDCTVIVSNRRTKVMRLESRRMSTLSFAAFDQGGLTEAQAKTAPEPKVECRDSSNRRKSARVYWVAGTVNPKTQ
jgi:hypothetical protein